LSGEATIPDARCELDYLKNNLPKEIGLVSCLGVAKGSEIYHRADIQGADYTQGVTVLLENLKKGITYGDTIRMLYHQYYDHNEQIAPVV
jgi:hypothetical protein